MNREPVERIRLKLKEAQRIDAELARDLRQIAGKRRMGLLAGLVHTLLFVAGATVGVGLGVFVGRMIWR